jgi:hypothetical protein
VYFNAIVKAEDSPSLELRNLELSVGKIDLNNNNDLVTITLYAYSLDSEVSHAEIRLYQPKGYPSTHYKYMTFRDWSLSTEENVYISKKNGSFRPKLGTRYLDASTFSTK